MHQAELNNVETALRTLQLALTRSDGLAGTADGDDLREAEDRLRAVLRRHVAEAATLGG